MGYTALKNSVPLIHADVPVALLRKELIGSLLAMVDLLTFSSYSFSC